MLGVCAFLLELCSYADNELAGAYLYYENTQLHVDVATLYADVLQQLEDDGYAHFSYDWATLAGEHLTYTDKLNVNVTSIAASIDASSAWTMGDETKYRGKQQWIFSPYSRVGSYTAVGLEWERELYATFVVPSFSGTVEKICLNTGLGDHEFEIAVSAACVVTIYGSPVYFYTPSWSWSTSWSGATSVQIAINERVGPGDLVQVSGGGTHSGAWTDEVFYKASAIVQEDATF